MRLLLQLQARLGPKLGLLGNRNLSRLAQFSTQPSHWNLPRKLQNEHRYGDDGTLHVKPNCKACHSVVRNCSEQSYSMIVMTIGWAMNVKMTNPNSSSNYVVYCCYYNINLARLCWSRQICALVPCCRVYIHQMSCHAWMHWLSSSGSNMNHVYNKIYFKIDMEQANLGQSLGHGHVYNL